MSTNPVHDKIASMVQSERGRLFDMENEEQLFDAALEAGIKAGATVLKYWPHPHNPHLDPALKMQLFHKNEGMGNYATSADLASREVILSVFKQHGFTRGINSEESEEKTETNDKLQWIVDEIDGTQNFNRGSDLFGINIAAFYDGEPVVGVIALPALDKILAASKGIVTLYKSDGSAIEQIGSLRSKEVSIDQARIGFDVPYANRQEQFRGFVANIADHVSGTLQYGSCAEGNYEVVCGSFDGYITPRPTWYDIGAPLAILSAVGVVTDQNGNKIKYIPGQKPPMYIATRSQNLHEQLLELINK